MGSFGTYSPPSKVTANMLPFVAGVDIDRGISVSIDSATGNAVLTDNTDPNPLACVGISANPALAGQIVFVQFADTISISTSQVISPGHFVGDFDGTGVLQDLGADQITISGPVAVAGICISQDGSGDTVILCLPLNFQGTGGGGGAVTSVFGRTGVVVQVSGDYDVSEITGAAPLASPIFTGNPEAPTLVDETDRSDSIATTNWAGNMTNPHFNGLTVTGTTQTRTLIIQSGSGSLLTTDTPGIVIGSSSVAGLGSGANGQVKYASDGRKVGELAGAGTGVLVYWSSTGDWRVFSTDTVVLS